MEALPDKKGEIIVVDNNSTDRTASLALKYGAQVVFEPIRQIARARNAGAMVAKGQHLFFVDADTFIPVPTFKSAINYMENGKVGGGGALLEFDQDHDRLMAGIILPKLWNLISRLTGLFAGSFIFCRAELFNKSNGFPETHFAGEEIAFHKSLKKECKKAGLVLMILKDHPVRSSARKLGWHKDWSILVKILPLVLCPLLLRSRKACSFWYQRPKSQS